MFWQAWWPDLEPTQVLRRLAEPRIVAQVSAGLLDETEQAALAAGITGEGWTVADIALLDELATMVGLPADEDEPLAFLADGAQVSEVVTTADRLAGARERDPDDEPHDTFAHLLVDEAQDLSPMQWRMLRRRGAHASWTIVGDPAQSSWPDPDESQRAMTELAGTGPSRQFRLSTNYRSPAEVFDLAAAVVRAAYPEADLPHAVRRTGIDPELVELDPAGLLDWLDERIARLAEQVEGTIGVIVAPSRLAEITTGLTGRPGAITAGDRLTVIEPLAAKGLEYDAVVVVSPDRVVAESPGGERVLYVALTRPTQRLVIADLGTSQWRDGLTLPAGT